MTEPQVRKTISSLTGRLDDMSREHAWRGIERALDANVGTVPRTERRWGWPIAFGIAAMTAAVLAILLVGPASTSLSSARLVAEAGEQTVLVRAGTELTLVGPGEVTVDGPRDGTLHVSVARGMLIAERSEDAAVLAVVAGDNTTFVRDRHFAIRVGPSMVVLATGERARTIVEHQRLLETAAPHAPIAQPPAPVVPPAPATRTDVSKRVSPLPVAEPVASEPVAKDPVVVGLSRTPAPAVTAYESSPPPSVKADVSFNANELYHRAEMFLASRDTTRARVLLEQLVRDYPTSSLVDAARYDLALMARADGDKPRALRLLEQIRTTGKDVNLKAAAARIEKLLR